MKNARDIIFRRLSDEQKRRGRQASVAALDTRIKSAPSHTRPIQSADLVDNFVRRFSARGGSVAPLNSTAEVVPAVVAYLREHALPPAVLLSSSAQVFAWPAELAIKTGAAQRSDLVSVSTCQLAIAETGSLLFCSAPTTPTTHNFVPDHHIVILRRSLIVPHQEDAWAQLRQRSGGMPRAVNIVSGPSRTGDIEQTIQLGAHGPRRVHVLMLD